MSWLLALWQILARFGEWLIERPGRLAIAFLAGLLAWHLWVADPRLRGQRDDALAALEQRTAERDQANANHRRTQASYRAAQAEAARRERERLARVKAEQQEVTDHVVADYRLRLADARARAERMRRELGGAGEHPAGAGGDLGMPGAGDAAGRAAGEAADRGLSIDERLVATEQAIQLDALIDWVEAQSSVRVNP